MITNTEDNNKLELSRDALIVFVLLSKLGSRCTKNEVLDAVSASPRDKPLDWANDAINSFGFFCNSGQMKASEISQSNLPALALSKNGQFAIIEEIFDDELILCESLNSKKRRLSKKEFKEWFSGNILYVQPALEGHKTVKARLKALSPLRTLGMFRFLWIALAAFLSNILGLATSLFIMIVYDRILPNQATESLYGLAIGVGIAILFDTLLKGARSRIVERVSVSADIAVNEDIFEQYIEVSNTKDRKSIGELSTIMQDFEVYRDFMSSATILMLIDLPFVLIFVLVWVIVLVFVFVSVLILLPLLVLVLVLVLV